MTQQVSLPSGPLDFQGPNPITFRLPKPGQVDPYFGANRAFWYERILPNEKNGFRPPIKSVYDRKKGARSGIRFIVFKSALEYFEAHLKEEVAA